MAEETSTPKRRPRTFLRAIRRQFGLLLVVSVVLLAAYVSAGRQFMPAISGYSEFVENQIFEITGVPVQVESLQGGFSGFNPVIEVNGLSMQVAADPDIPESIGRALDFDRGTVVVDMGRSIWQRRWVLQEFVVERLELDLEQTSDGGWLLGDIEMQGGAGIDPDTLYQAFLDITQLDLRDVVVNMHTRSGEQLRFINGVATIQNRGGNHFLHVDITPEGQSRQLALSLEVRGGDLSAIDGSFHLALPTANYSGLLDGQSIAGVNVEELIGGGDIWVDFESGDVRRIVATAELDTVTLNSARNNPTTIDPLTGAFEVRWEEGSEHYSVSGLSFGHEGASWPRTNLYLSHQPEQSLSIRADRFDVAIAASLAANLELLPESAGGLLGQLQPAGVLENFELQAPLRENSGELASLRANVAGGAVASVRNSPAMTGLAGYLEVSADLDGRRASGRIEVDSTDFTINIPRVYTATWPYDEMNGSLEFELDYNEGQKLRLTSSVLTGRLGEIETRLQLTSALEQQPDGERENELELLIGVLNMDAAEKSLFLPDGPGVRDNLREGMEFLERAIIDGRFSNSAAIFRGQTVQGSDRITKTFQSFHQWHDGSMRFDPEWPVLESERSLVLSDDENIDIFMENSSSLGLRSTVIEGTIRGSEPEASLLVVSGAGRSSSADGLAYLQAVPAAEDLRRAMADWSMQGSLQGEFELEVPLGVPEADTEIRMHMEFSDNDLWISQYELDLTEVNGELLFDTRTGIETGEFEARMFGGETGIEVSSRGEPGEVDRIVVVSRGRADRRALMQWPRQSELVKGLLDNARGSFLYSAELHLDQMDTGATSLRVSSDLAGLFLTLPEPFAKQAGEPLPLNLQVDQAGGVQSISGSVGSRLRFNLESADSTIRQGRVRLGGGRSDTVEPADGLVVDGRLDRMVLEQWTALLGDMQSASPEELHEVFAFMEIDAGELDVFGQALEDVHLRIDPVSRGWLASVGGESVEGTVEIPLDVDDYLQVQLDYLRFKGPEEPEPEPDATAQADAAEEPEPLRVDLLAGVDPRELPRMHFAVDEISIGETPWGRWNFILEPDAGGADFTDLSFDFRGLRLTPPAEEEAGQLPAGRLRWDFDGRNHATELAGLLLADDMAAVLLDSGFAASLESQSARFAADLRWPGSPAFLQGSQLSGNVDLLVENGRFLETSAGGGALKLISIINFDAIMRRLRLSDDLLRRGLAFDEITGRLNMDRGLAQIENELVISGPSSLYQITGDVDLRDETIAGEMYVTLPVSDNIPWIGLITGNLPLAVGAFLLDQIFGNQVDSLTSAVYTLEGPWEGLEPEFKQAFGAPGEE
ncbi:MAG: TIGR02099 family protein [Gammaproteobacteria bacterium]|nr:TIGR02099 family protein [Gammaproteobacteria bacterium]